MQLVADINPGAGNSNPGEFTLFNGRLVFAAEGPQGRELYQVDQQGNVTLFSDVNPGAGGSSPEQLTVFNNRLYFSAQVNSGRELYVATTGGTSSLVADLRLGRQVRTPAISSSTATTCSSRRPIRTSAASIGYDQRLTPRRPRSTWVPVITDPQDFTAVRRRGLLQRARPSDGRELFMLHYGFSDEERVHEIADLNPGSAGSNPSDFFAFQNALYFAATGPNGRELYRIVDNHGPDPYNFSNNWWDDHRSLNSDELRQFNIAPGQRKFFARQFCVVQQHVVLCGHG